MRQSLAYQELELAGLVAAQRKACLVVSFYEEAGTREPFR
jgi:hypothetical protein